MQLDTTKATRRIPDPLLSVAPTVAPLLGLAIDVSEATIRNLPIVVLLDDNGGGETLDGGVVWEHADDIAAPIDSPMEAF